MDPQTPLPWWVDQPPLSVIGLVVAGLVAVWSLCGLLVHLLVG